MNRLIVSTALVVILGGSAAYAGGIPVFDGSANAQLIEQVANDAIVIAKMADDYASQESQRVTGETTLASLTGGRNMGSLLNGGAERSLRRKLPDDFRSIYDMGNSGNLGGAGAVRGIFDSLKGEFKPLQDDDFATYRGNQVSTASYKRASTTNLATMAAAEEAYDNIAARRETIEQLMVEIDSTEDLKASTDLQNRLIAENALLQIDQAKLESLNLGLHATAQNDALAGRRATREALAYNQQKASQ